jgi:hypothetical protein
VPVTRHVTRRTVNVLYAEFIAVRRAREREHE